MPILEAASSATLLFSLVLPCNADEQIDTATQILRAANAQDKGQFSNLVAEDVKWSIRVADTWATGTTRPRVVAKIGGPREQLRVWLSNRSISHVIVRGGEMICLTKGPLTLELVSEDRKASILAELTLSANKLTRLEGERSTLTTIELAAE